MKGFYLFLQKPISLIFLTGTKVLLFSFFAHSELFITSYLSLELPKNWKCLSEGANWVCHNKISRKLAKEAIIVLTAKEKGSKDSVGDYISYLKKRKTHFSKKRKKLISKVFHSKQRQIKSHPWADGFHLESELQNYYTRYLGSTKKSLAVLVTYSAHKKLWKKYSSDFNKSIQSLQLLNVDQALKKIRTARGRSGSQGIKDYIDALIGDGDIDFEGEGGRTSMSDLWKNHKDKIIGGVLGVTALGTLLFRMLRRKSSKKSKKRAVSKRRRRKK